MNEIWKPIPGYEKFYEVSNYGLVRSTFGRSKILGQFKILKPEIDKDGYLRVLLHDRKGSRKHYQIHRIVLTTFVGLAPDNHQCAHLNGNKKENHLNNLKWVTQVENESHKELHGTRIRGEKQWLAKLTSGKVLEMRSLRNQGISMPEIAKQFGFKYGTVKAAINGQNWKHIEKKNLLDTLNPKSAKEFFYNKGIAREGE